MSADPNKKSARTFQCRDVLWETFEQMARELECSVDYLINEAMKQYARQRSYGGSRTPYPAPGRGVDQQPSSDRGPRAPTAAARCTVASSRTAARRRRRAPCRLPRGACLLRPVAPLRSRRRRPAAAQLPAPPRAAARPRWRCRRCRARCRRRRCGTRACLRPCRARPRRCRPRPPTASPAPRAHGSTLSLVYQGERYAITKDRFVIGRGKQSSDLTLKDPNVSRQHAMIEFQNGVYFMVDMGSTNGVEFNGQRIARKQIAEGDVFRICDHDILFTYR